MNPAQGACKVKTVGLTSITVLSICISACAAKQPTPNEIFAEKALQDVRDSMKDPTSVKFKDVIAIPSAKCMYGKVLSKNGFGGYNGYQDFAWLNGKLAINDSSTEPDPMKSAEILIDYFDIENVCTKANLDIMSSSSYDKRLDIPEA
jgi:hypothetical protein